MTNTVTASAALKRRTDLDACKVLLITLVVFGHITLKGYPPGNIWYEYLHYAIAEFHMPAFMYVSGFVFAVARRKWATTGGYFYFIGERAKRLLIPFLAMAVLIVGGKILARHFLPVDGVPQELGKATLSVLGFGAESPVNSIWFMYVLFIVSVVHPIILRIFRGNTIIPVFIGVALFFAPRESQFTYWPWIQFSYFFFSFGFALGERSGEYSRFLDRARPILLVAFVVVIVAATFNIQARWTMLVSGIAGCLAIHSLCRLSAIGGSPRIIQVSQFVFVIYLFNTIFIGVTKGLILKFSSWDGAMFLLWAPVLFAAGFFGPVALKRLFLSKIAILDKYTS